MTDAVLGRVAGLCCAGAGGASSLDLGQPLPGEEEQLLKATITIQRAVSPRS